MDFTRKEAKAWAKQNYHGLEGVLMPSFTPDLGRLDEEGIRHDVNYYIEQGMFSVLAAAESTAMTFAERCEFVRIACEEARGRMLISAPVLLDTFGQDVEFLKYFASVGGHHALLGCPVQFHPGSQDEVFQTLKTVCESVDLCIDLYPAARFDLGRFGQGTLSVDIIRRLADIDNVVALKVGNLNPPNYTAHVFSKVGDQLLINDPLDHAWAYVVGELGCQWAGGMGYDMWQTKDDQRVVRMFNHFRAGQLDEAMDIYWAIEPVRAASWQLHGRLSSSGLYPFLSFKFQQWLVGGNGGMLRQPIHRISEWEMESLRSALEASGVEPYAGPIEEFFVGRAAYARGERMPSFQIPARAAQ